MYDFLKRLTDILAAVFVVLLFSPLIILISVAIKLDSAGPIIFKQKRVGKNSKCFDIWKFRSMYDHSEEIVAKDKEFLKKFKKKEGWKLNADEDPRITRVGRFIRKYSLDELPNLYNILVGDMSIVGPRAYRDDDVFGNEINFYLKSYPDLKKELEISLSVKPGLTGPWQTSGRNAVSWDKRVALDAMYARQRNIFQDFLYVIKTPFAVLNRW